jgi:sepiapterin reductase
VSEIAINFIALAIECDLGFTCSLAKKYPKLNQSNSKFLHKNRRRRKMDESCYWNKKTFAIVTGASRGIGRTLAEKISQQIGPDSVLLLISRDEKDLDSLQKAIETDRPSVRVHVGVTDLSNCDESALNGVVSSALAGESAESFAHALCVHNAGSLGDATKRCTDLLSVNSCVQYFQLNLASVVVLNAIFLRRFTSPVVQQRKTVVNMSSLCGVEPFSSLSLYCTGKAGRDMFFKVINPISIDPLFLLGWCCSLFYSSAIRLDRF